MLKCRLPSQQSSIRGQVHALCLSKPTDLQKEIYCVLIKEPAVLYNTTCKMFELFY